jgi:hypothetical protein
MVGRVVHTEQLTLARYLGSSWPPPASTSNMDSFPTRGLAHGTLVSGPNDARHGQGSVEGPAPSAIFQRAPPLASLTLSTPLSFGVYRLHNLCALFFLYHVKQATPTKLSIAPTPTFDRSTPHHHTHCTSTPWPTMPLPRPQMTPRSHST